jgi:peptide/nickel transport system substrate-binding protein
LFVDARIGRRAALASMACAPLAFARGRSPVGGRVTLRVPWPLASIDPHRIDDIACAIFGGAIFDSLYAIDQGRIVPSLAESMPEPANDGMRVRLRAGVSSAAGRPMIAREVIASLARARNADASAWLADVPAPRRIDDLTIHFGGVDPMKLATSLASPLCAIVPVSFHADHPDATGAFAASHDGAALALTRNARAAEGPAFLDAITAHPASDLADSLRAFEAGTDDVGWLGLGLHDPRAGARAFDAGLVAYALLRTGRDAGAWDTPGIAQRLANGIAPSLLAHLAPGPAWNVEPDQGWGGAPCDLIVRDDAPYLVEVARAIAAALSRPNHEVTVRPVPNATLRERRASRGYALAIDAARPFTPGLLGTLAALATSDNPELARDAVRHPPRIGDLPARTLARTMRVGVVAEIHAQGGRVADLALPPGASGIDWASATRGSRR